MAQASWFSRVYRRQRTSGLAALDNATFDLMIADVFMPEVRGFGAIRLFHQRAPKVPMVAISGSAFPEMDGSAPDFLRLATALGATRCLAKPFKLVTLLGVIDECLTEAEPHRRQIATFEAVADALLDHEMSGPAGRVSGGML